MTKLCVYQGTFNPVHKEHIEVAKYAHDILGYEKILFIPAYKPPHKTMCQEDEHMPEHRLNMLKLAVKNYPYFEVSDIEYKRNELSYTYYTIKELVKTCQFDGRINFLIGTDAFKYIETWHKSDELKEMVKFIVFNRENVFEEKTLYSLKEKGYVFKMIDKPFVDISSSEIRNRVMQNKSIYDIVPQETADYIKEHGLYKN